jgi:hypothetical protein
MRILLTLLAAFAGLCRPAYCQRLYFGVIGGTGITADFPVTDVSTPADAFGNPPNRFQYLPGPRSMIFGAMVAAKISERLAIEADVLHRPMKAEIVFTNFYPNGSTTTDHDRFNAVRAWEFPVLFKYTLSGGRISPYLEAGPSLRTQEDASATEPSRFGLSGGAGLAFNVGPIRFAPGLRYTRWMRENIAPKYVTKADQLELLTSISVHAQAESLKLLGRQIALGAVAGWSPLRGYRDFDFSGYVPEKPNYFLGLGVELALLRDLSLELNGIYKALRAGGDQTSHFSVLTWQFPALAKYRWKGPAWTPFAEAGPSFRLSGNLNGYNPSKYGITAGAGIETRAHGVRLAPTLRYTRWAGDAPLYPGPPGFHYEYPRTNPNALELLFGVSF